MVGVDLQADSRLRRDRSVAGRLVPQHQDLGILGIAMDAQAHHAQSVTPGRSDHTMAIQSAQPAHDPAETPAGHWSNQDIEAAGPVGRRTRPKHAHASWVLPGKRICRPSGYGSARWSLQVADLHLLKICRSAAAGDARSRPFRAVQEWCVLPALPAPAGAGGS